MKTVPSNLTNKDQDAFAVAVLHIAERHSQRDIAKQLGTNPTQVSRLLAHAESCGFITPAKINFPLDESLALKINLMHRLPKVAEIRIALTDPRFSDQSSICAVGCAAAVYWEHCEKTLFSHGDQIKIALSGGRGIAASVDVVKLDEGKSHECFSIANIPTGDWQVAADTNLAVLKRRFPKNIAENSEKQMVDIRPLGTLPFSKEMTEEEIVESRRKVLEQERVTQLMDDFRECNLVFTGIGSIDDPNMERMINAIGLSKKDIPKTVTGDIGYNFVHHDTKVIHEDDDLGKRLISVPMRHLQAIARNRDKARVVAVAWGKTKAAPLLDAYRGGLINAMVIDTALGDEMLRLLKETKYLDV